VGVIKLIGILVRALLANRAALAMENLALRQQLAVLERSVKRPALRQRDRIFWAWLSRLWNGWRADRRCELVQRRRRTTAEAQKPAGFDADGVFSRDRHGRRIRGRPPIP